MRMDVVVVATPGFDHDAGLGAAAEPLERQALVTEVAVKALGIAVLPRRARLDERRLDLRVLEPFEDRASDELRTVVQTQEPRCTVLGNQAGTHLDHAAGSNRAGHVARKCLAAELIDHRQALDLPAAGAGVEHEVVGPDVIRSRCRQRPRRRSRHASAGSFARQLQPRQASQAMRAVPAHGVTLSSQEHSNSPIAVAGVLDGNASPGIQARPIALGAHRAVAQPRARAISTSPQARRSSTGPARQRSS